MQGTPGRKRKHFKIIWVGVFFLMLSNIERQKRVRRIAGETGELQDGGM